MRRTRCLAPILAMALLAAALWPAVAFAARTTVSLGFFDSGLSPHGSWYESTDFGRVWQPRGIASGWHPYHRGHWVYTEVGWTWVSDHAWGAIPFTSRFSIENGVVANRGIDVKRIERFVARPVERQLLAHVPNVSPLQRAKPDAL